MNIQIKYTQKAALEVNALFEDTEDLDKAISMLTTEKAEKISFSTPEGRFILRDDNTWEHWTADYFKKQVAIENLTEK